MHLTGATAFFNTHLNQSRHPIDLPRLLHRLFLTHIL